jgi:uncharacterized protein YbjT (DUF2867 family)
MTKRKIVLLGATGKVGSQVAHTLLAQGHQLTLIARNEEKLLPFKALGATTVATPMADVDKLTAALSQADVVLTMIPSNPVAENFIADQREQANAQIEAIVQSGIQYVVNLSSNGCHVAEGNGIIQGLSEMEAQLDQLANVQVLHLRPTFYMENVFYALGLIKHQGIYGLPIRPDTRFPMIATKDVAAVAAQQLAQLGFSGKSIMPILGPQDYTLTELADAVGKAIGKEPLPYIQFAVADFIGGIVATGGSPDFARRFADLMVATDNGLLNHHPRTPENTTPTTITTFAEIVFAPAYLHS